MRVGVKQCFTNVISIEDRGDSIEIELPSGRICTIFKEHKWGDIIITKIGDLDESNDNSRE